MKAVNSIPAITVTVSNLQVDRGLKTGQSLFHSIIMILVGMDLTGVRNGPNGVQLPDLFRTNQKLKQTLRTFSKCLLTSDRHGAGAIPKKPAPVCDHPCDKNTCTVLLAEAWSWQLTVLSVTSATHRGPEQPDRVPPLFQVQEKLLLSACHLLVSLATTVRPVFLISIPAVQKVFNRITDTSAQRLPDKVLQLCVH